eukprot:GHVO01028437.1.p1 GENE.GHVO01028437.1~~GHVO01028437.1.p1  ORF type:complete len:155 (+),score=19.62 GHVO01028437.1:144-608(+)
MTMGVLILMIQQTVPIRAFVVVVSVAVVVKVWFFRPFRYARPRDIGITMYTLILIVWAGCGWDFRNLATMFFADPCAAIVGRSVASPKWIGNKTVAGSLTALVVTAIVLSRTVPLSDRIALAFSVAFLEAVGGPYDNLFAALPQVVYAAVKGTL